MGIWVCMVVERDKSSKSSHLERVTPRDLVEKTLRAVEREEREREREREKVGLVMGFCVVLSCVCVVSE